ncbi:MAG TPA: ATP-dependent protease ATPase subunit HslU [Candidatus Kapabacteria bacterium]|nr:ATP-dependent protease ATPase subunit HslU [Candidatus Kapabacteria bacterium]
MEELETIQSAKTEAVELTEQSLTPHEIVRELDKYIIGQNNAKRSVAIALRNRWRRLQVSGDLRDEIMPNNIILIGPTGVGKTEIARRLAKLAGAPFIKVEATKYTEVGYVGRDVESMIRDLADQGVNMVRSEQLKKVEAKAREIAEERLLDVLVPPLSDSNPTSASGVEQQPFGFLFRQPNGNGNGSENGNGEPTTEQTPSGPTDEQVKQAASHQRTRSRFRKKLKEGELDDREIEVDVSEAPPIASMQIMGPVGGFGMDEIAQNLQDAINNMVPKKTKPRRLTVAQARTLFMQEESAKLIDQEAVAREAIKRVEHSGIVFIDEIDKVAGRGKDGSPDVSREGVQRDLLPIVEGSTVATRYGAIKTDHILFIASGAFHLTKPSDLIPEMQGRFPIRVELESLTQEDFVKILTQPQNALLKQYTALLETEGVAISFTDSAISAVARIAFEVNESVENIGARRLHTILTTLLDSILFDVPDIIVEKELTITPELVEEKLASVARDRDLSRYIL